MPVVFVIAVLAVLVGVFYAATGRGGELAYEQTDHAPLDLGPVSAPDIALLRPPTALWGYNMQVTDEALDHIARAVRDRDITIAYLQEELANREPGDLNAPYGTVPPTRPEAFYPPAGQDSYSEAGADTYPRASAEPYPLTDPDAFRYPGPSAPSGTSPESIAPSDDGVPDTGPTDTGPTDTGPAPAIPDALPPPRSPAPPGILVASRPRDVPQSPAATQPYDITDTHDVAEPHDATQPYDVAQPQDVAQPPHEATQPSATMPAPEDTLGPQGPFDTHNWWAEQEEAAREDARRRPEAENVGLALSGESDASGGAPSGPASTVPNPVVLPPDETDTPPGGAGQGSAGPARSHPPHDDGLSIAEEQAW